MFLFTYDCFQINLFGHFTPNKTISSTHPSHPHNHEIKTLIRGITRQFVALSWLNVTPLTPTRLSVLPHHVTVTHRLARLVSVLDLSHSEDREEKESNSNTSANNNNSPIFGIAGINLHNNTPPLVQVPSLASSSSSLHVSLPVTSNVHHT